MNDGYRGLRRWARIRARLRPRSRLATPVAETCPDASGGLRRPCRNAQREFTTEDTGGHRGYVSRIYHPDWPLLRGRPVPALRLVPKRREISAFPISDSCRGDLSRRIGRISASCLNPCFNPCRGPYGRRTYLVVKGRCAILGASPLRRASLVGLLGGTWGWIWSRSFIGVSCGQSLKRLVIRNGIVWNK